MTALRLSPSSLCTGTLHSQTSGKHENENKSDARRSYGPDRAVQFGEDGTGWQFKYLTRGGGHYFNVGCSDLIVEGEIGLVQLSDIATFVSAGALMRTGETLAADLIVLATGYKGQDYLVSRLFGDDVAARVGPIWGFGDGGELRNSRERRSRAYGSSPAASPNAASTQSISGYRSSLRGRLPVVSSY
jgi:hypothetical protein